MAGLERRQAYSIPYSTNAPRQVLNTIPHAIRIARLRSLDAHADRVPSRRLAREAGGRAALCSQIQASSRRAAGSPAVQRDQPIVKPGGDRHGKVEDWDEMQAALARGGPDVPSQG
jgi:hypothetical protein